MLVLLFFAAGAQAQYSVDNKKAVAAFEKGLELLPTQPDKAFVQFAKALKAEPHFAEVHLTMAGWYMEHDSLDAAEKCYGQFLGYGSRHKAWAATARHDLSCIAFRREAMANPVPFTPVNMGLEVNSGDDEYFPTLSADGQTLFFTRRFPRTARTTATSREEEDFYCCRMVEGRWSQAERMAEPVNSYDNEGSGCLSQDGRRLIFTACGRPDGAGRCDLYITYRKGKGWSRPQNLGPAINTSAYESQPCLSLDGHTLFFVSDRKGGYGGLDIWCSTLMDDGGWSKPRNLGPAINTSGNEKSPFLAFDNQTLYFASDGHIGMGNMDLFVSRRINDTTWDQPQNLGYPINTSGDESSLIVSPDGSTALFSSDKFGGQGRLDLYSFPLPEPVRSDPVTYRDTITEVAPTLSVGTSITLQNVFFQTGKHALLDISRVELDKVVEMLADYPSLHIELGGHTDNVGNDAYNQRLSEQRAKAVYDYLVGHGIDTSRLTYKGYGDSQPVGDNNTPEGRRANRRTVLTIIEK